jgi:sugar-specific transcriptional regulator TrmB
VKKYKVYLIDDRPAGYVGKLKELHEQNSYGEINLVAPSLGTSLKNSLGNIFSKISEDNEASAVMLDNHFQIGSSCVWLHALISENEKIKNSLKKIIEKNIKIIIFTNQTRADEPQRLKDVIQAVAQGAEGEIFVMVKSNPDEEKWVKDLKDILEGGKNEESHC